MLEAVLWETVEDRLRVALIKPGSFRYEQMKVADMGLYACNKGGTAYITSLAIGILRGALFFLNRKETNYENHIKGWLRKGVCRK